MQDRALAARISLVVAAVLVCAASGANAAAVDDRYAADPKLRRFVDSMHGETIAVELGRMVYRKRWEEVLTEGLYLVAPRGAWNESHPAWPAARQALADTLRPESVQWLAANRDRVRLVINDKSMRAMTEEERRHTAEFFETHGGQVWRDSREAYARTGCRSSLNRSRSPISAGSKANGKRRCWIYPKRATARSSTISCNRRS